MSAERETSVGAVRAGTGPIRAVIATILVVVPWSLCLARKAVSNRAWSMVVPVAM
jgi:hypothetical protein